MFTMSYALLVSSATVIVRSGGLFWRIEMSLYDGPMFKSLLGLELCLLVFMCEGCCCCLVICSTCW